MNLPPTSSTDSDPISIELASPLIQKSENVLNPSKNTNIEPNRNIHQYLQNSLNKTKSSEKLLCLSQLGTITFYQALFSELIGTMLLTLVCTSTGLPVASKPIPDLYGALAAGCIIILIIIGFGHISGAHVNPAVTITFLVTCEIDIMRALCYISMQLLGAASASSLLRFLAPSFAQGNLGMTMITKDVTIIQAIIVEAIITFVLCYTIHAICDKKRDDIGGLKAVAVGLAVTVGCLFGGSYTGASMNPARSFGPAITMNSWENHWVYWLGPLTGSIFAGIIYGYLLKYQISVTTSTDIRTHKLN